MSQSSETATATAVLAADFSGLSPERQKLAMDFFKLLEKQQATSTKGESDLVKAVITAFDGTKTITENQVLDLMEAFNITEAEDSAIKEEILEILQKFAPESPIKAPITSPAKSVDSWEEPQRTGPLPPPGSENPPLPKVTKVNAWTTTSTPATKQETKKKKKITKDAPVTIDSVVDRYKSFEPVDTSVRDQLFITVFLHWVLDLMSAEKRARNRRCLTTGMPTINVSLALEEDRRNQVSKQMEAREREQQEKDRQAKEMEQLKMKAAREEQARKDFETRVKSVTESITAVRGDGVTVTINCYKINPADEKEFTRRFSQTFYTKAAAGDSFFYLSLGNGKSAMMPRKIAGLATTGNQKTRSVYCAYSKCTNTQCGFYHAGQDFVINSHTILCAACPSFKQGNTLQNFNEGSVTEIGTLQVLTAILDASKTTESQVTITGIRR